MNLDSPKDVINAFACERISRDELEFILNSPCFGLDRFEYIDCLLEADDLKANCSHQHEAGRTWGVS